MKNNKAVELIICVPAKKRIIFVFGSESWNDSIAFRTAERLKEEFGEKAEFVFADDLSAKEFGEKEFQGIDAASGIRKVELIESIDALGESRGMSVHGFDLAFQLKLLKKTGRISGIKVIAIPLGYGIEKAVAETREKLRAILL
ncbi:MAG: hypothetical protein WC602_01715 [archaeon]